MTRPSRSRDVRSTRREVRRAKEWEAVRSLEMVETEPEDLSAWLSDSPFPLPSGTQVDPREPWELPTKESKC